MTQILNIFLIVGYSYSSLNNNVKQSGGENANAMANGMNSSTIYGRGEGSNPNAIPPVLTE